MTALAAALTVVLATAAPPAGVAPGVVDGPTAHRLVAAGVKVVDVRSAEEFAEGHVPGALNIPHGEIARRAGEIGPPETPVLLYCASGHRSNLASQALRGRGFTTIYDLKTYQRWLDADAKKLPGGR